MNKKERIGDVGNYTMKAANGHTVTVPVRVLDYKKGTGGDNWKIESALDEVEVTIDWVRKVTFD